MRLFTQQVFDETISGASSTWYTSASFNEQLGKADSLFLHAVTMAVSGTSPKLTCQLEHSADGRKWVDVSGTPEINDSAMANDGSLTGSSAFTASKLGFVRMRISLSATSGTPGCRLKVFVTGRSRAVTAMPSRANMSGTGGAAMRSATGPSRSSGAPSLSASKSRAR